MQTVGHFTVVLFAPLIIHRSALLSAFGFILSAVLYQTPKPKHCFLCAALLASRSYSHGKQETDEEFDARWVTYFNKPDIDAWELKKGLLID